jgi:hypothetical protein
MKEPKIYAFWRSLTLFWVFCGSKFLLERFKICFDCEGDHAWLEEKEPKIF